MAIAADKTDATPTLVDHAAHHNALATAANLATTHGADTANPHVVTKAQVGLGSVDNTSDAAKPISTAQQAALDLKQDAVTAATDTELAAHTGNTSNPHAVTKTQVGLGSVDNTSDANKPVSTAQQAAIDAGDALAIPLTQKAAASGVASLSGTSRVVQSPKLHHTDHEPGGVDAMAVDASAATGSLRTLGTGVAQAAQGSVVAAHQADTANPHAVTKTQVGLGSVDNTADAAKPVSSAQQAAINLVSSQPYSLGRCWTVDPRNGVGAASAGTTNRCVFVRAMGAKTGVTKVGIVVGVQSGNMSVAVYPNTGTGVAAAPTTPRKASSGAVAVPVSGYAEIALGSTIDVADGDWIALSVDNATATFSRAGSPLAAQQVKGLCCAQSTAHPAPTTPTGLFDTSSFVFWMEALA